MHPPELGHRFSVESGPWDFIHRTAISDLGSCLPDAIFILFSATDVSDSHSVSLPVGAFSARTHLSRLRHLFMGDESPIYRAVSVCVFRPSNQEVGNVGLR